MAELLASSTREAPEVIVVGLPLHAPRRAGPAGRETEAFVGRLRARCRDPDRAGGRAIHDVDRQTEPTTSPTAARRPRTTPRRRRCCSRAYLDRRAAGERRRRGGRGASWGRRSLLACSALVVLGLRAADRRALRRRSAAARARRSTVTIPRARRCDAIGDILDSAGRRRQRPRAGRSSAPAGDGDGFKPARTCCARTSDYEIIVATLKAGPPAAPTVQLHDPGGLRDPRHRGERRAERRHLAEGSTARAVARRQAAGGLPREGRERLDDRGLPVPGDLRRCSDAGLGRRARRRSSWPRSSDNGRQVDFRRAREEEPDEVRRPDHRLDDRARGRLRRRPRARSRPSSTTACARHAARHRRHDPVRASARGSRSPAGPRASTGAYNTRKHRGLPPTPIATPAWPR